MYLMKWRILALLPPKASVLPTNRAKPLGGLQICSFLIISSALASFLTGHAWIIESPPAFSHPFLQLCDPCQHSLRPPLSFLETFRDSPFLLYQTGSNTPDGIQSPPQPNSHPASPAFILCLKDDLSVGILVGKQKPLQVLEQRQFKIGT